ncbi:uncharacterized protein CLUP02_03855 [Colletotrichum lupini]|uniref:Uncharacterized protein n=1 Tax=Colletotrichum lupini TaxID=145971 RepID=A0A9Q8SJN5_9PEZI|nr:uncharacterized protein CLUP02_03855 [Colletotrichum lupini]UQC78378.1 hypothetical protein CLUP02_03855 [Colletotrichum lupini]
MLENLTESCHCLIFDLIFNDAPQDFRQYDFRQLLVAPPMVNENLESVTLRARLFGQRFTMALTRLSHDQVLRTQDPKAPSGQPPIPSTIFFPTPLHRAFAYCRSPKCSPGVLVAKASWNPGVPISATGFYLQYRFLVPYSSSFRTPPRFYIPTPNPLRSLPQIQPPALLPLRPSDDIHL